ncbi:magnesium transporter CorA family protein [archaeon]|nr:magnesium transporter CorA family protein [archaeon]
MLKYIYIDHKSKKISRGENFNFPSVDKGCVWLFLSNPNEEEKTRISKDFEIENLYLRDYSREVRSKRYSTTPLIFVMVDYYVDNGNIKKTNILMIIKKDIFITILPTDLKQFNAFFDEIFDYMNEKGKKNRNIGEVLYEFLDRDVQDNYEVLRRAEEKINIIEKNILFKEQKVLTGIDEVLILKRELFAMSRRFWATAKIVFLLKKGLLTVDISKKTAGLLEDTYDTFQHQMEILEKQREMLSDVMTLYQATVNNKLTIISNDINTVMKRLTSLTFIVTIPTLITSVYGMNFTSLPRADTETGFWEVIIVTTLVALIIYYIFHKKKWI